MRSYRERGYGRIDIKVRKNWLLPAVGGIVIGAVLAGAPLSYKVMGLQEQLGATSRAANEAALTAHNKLVGVQAQLDATAQQLDAELESARATAASTARELEQQRELSVELAKPEIPLQLSVRRGFVDSGYVLQIRNPTADDIVAAATFQSPNGQKLNRLVVNANLAKELGESEGWAFASRNTVTLRVPGHRDLIYMVPLY